MSDENRSIYLKRIEWIGLQSKYRITENISFPILKDTANCIEVWRGEDYKINAKIEGIFRNPKDTLNNTGTPGEFIEPIEITGENYHGIDVYKLKYCYIGNVLTRYVSDTLNNYHKNYEAELMTYRVERGMSQESEISWLTEWYINGPKMQFLFPRVTSRKVSENYIRNRDMDKKDNIIFKGFESESTEQDYALVDCDEFKFLIQAVPKEFEPIWSEKVGVEYRKEFGRIPGKNEREAISEIISFILGRQILNVGCTSFNEDGYPLQQVDINPNGDNILSVCQKIDNPPIKLGTYDTWGKIEAVLKQLTPKYLELRETLNLSEALWRYWISYTLPLGTNLPILSNAVEIIASAWFSSNKSKIKGVYIPKKDFDDLFSEECKRQISWCIDYCTPAVR